MKKPSWTPRIGRGLRPLLAFLLVTVLCGSAMTLLDLAPGDSAQVGGDFIFYFKTGEMRHTTLLFGDERMVATPSWSASNGLTLESGTVAISPATVSWHVEGSGQTTKYSAQGYRITAHATLKVGPEAALGEKQAVVHLPGLAVVARELGAVIAVGEDTPSDLMLRNPDTLVVASVVVRTPMGKLVARSWIYIVLAALALLFLGVGVNQYRRRPAVARA